MGWSPQVIVLVLVLVCPSSPSICDYSQCNCTSVGHIWINAVCVFNNTQRQLDITPDTLPKDLSHLEISGPREMVLYNGSFSRNLTGLKVVKLVDIGTLTVEKRAFARLAHPHLRLEVAGAHRVILESSAFCELKASVVSVRLERVDHLIVQTKAFDRLLALDISQVEHLNLQAEAFFYELAKSESQGPATKITLDRVKMKELPSNVFPVLNNLTIVNSEIDVVKSSSFRALFLTTVKLENTTLGLVETEAFTTRSSITTLELTGVGIGELQSNCVQSGISQLVIQGSRVRDVSESAFNTVTANVSFSENVFDRVQSRGFTLKDTTLLIVDNNRFNIIEDSAFSLTEGESANPIINVTFKENSLGKEIGRGILEFPGRKQVAVYVNGNRFENLCQCEDFTKKWLKEKFNGSGGVIDDMYQTSFCKVNSEFSRCFNIVQGMLIMENFTAQACDSEGLRYCPPEVIQSDAADPPFPSSTSDIMYKNSNERERKVLGSIFIFVISGVVLMLFFSGFMWLRRNGYCTKARLLLLPSAESMLNIISRMFVGSTTAPGSGTVPNRVPVHEYAELQQAQKLAEESVEEDISLEDKATQTLPEELTQELLQTLREKLDDPDNYGEARDMIEHLYDLIKVEESCNQNSDFTSLQLDELEDPGMGENVYDVIQPKPKTKTRVPREKKSLVSVGTRAPSPDKLLPLSLSRRKQTVLCDYMEPRDRQHHVYQELPATHSVLCDYAEPPDTKPHVYQELPVAIANRPLPSKPDPGAGPSSR